MKQGATSSAFSPTWENSVDRNSGQIPDLESGTLEIMLEDITTGQARWTFGPERPFPFKPNAAVRLHQSGHSCISQLSRSATNGNADKCPSSHRRPNAASLVKRIHSTALWEAPQLASIKPVIKIHASPLRVPAHQTLKPMLIQLWAGGVNSSFTYCRSNITWPAVTLGSPSDLAITIPPSTTVLTKSESASKSTSA